MVKTSLKYETAPCGRCGGSGHYSYNSMHGTTCYGCSGRKWALTRAGAKAQQAVQDFTMEHFSVLASELQVGDRVKHDGYVRVITAIDRNSSWSITRNAAGEEVREAHVTVTWDKPIPSFLGPVNGHGLCPGTRVQKAVVGADWDAVVAFAKTIKKGVTVEVKEVK